MVGTDGTIATTQTGTVNSHCRLQSDPLYTAYSDYRSGITSAYKAMSVIEFYQWPPVKKYFYIDLVLITPYKKERINFDLVFPKKLASSQRFVCLIEGRPGCGKSSLITKVSKDWSEGKILQDINVFILVCLRQFVGKADLFLKACILRTLQLLIRCMTR